MKKILLLFVITTALIIKVTAQNTLHISKNGYTIAYPKNWSVLDAQKIPLINFGALAPLENAEDLFAENFNVIIDDTYNPNISLKEYRDASAEGIVSILNTAKLIAKGFDSTQNNLPAATLVYTHTTGTLNLKVLVYIYVHNKNAFIITCSAQEKDYNSYESAFLAICRSFSLNK